VEGNIEGSATISGIVCVSSGGVTASGWHVDSSGVHAHVDAYTMVNGDKHILGGKDIQFGLLK
jgi:hypothetical protein